MTANKVQVRAWLGSRLIHNRVEDLRCCSVDSTPHRIASQREVAEKVARELVRQGHEKLHDKLFESDKAINHLTLCVRDAHEDGSWIEGGVWSWWHAYKTYHLAKAEVVWLNPAEDGAVRTILIDEYLNDERGPYEA